MIFSGISPKGSNDKYCLKLTALTGLTEKNDEQSNSANTVKSTSVIELMDRLEQAIIDTQNLTPIEIVGALEMVKARYTLAPLVNELQKN